MEVIADRHEIAHTDIRSATKQRAVLDECSTFTFADTKSEFIALKILPHLKSITTLKRMTWEGGERWIQKIIIAMVRIASDSENNNSHVMCCVEFFRLKKILDFTAENAMHFVFSGGFHMTIPIIWTTWLGQIRGQDAFLQTHYLASPIHQAWFDYGLILQSF